MVMLTFGLVLFLGIVIFLVFLVVQKEKPEDVRPTIHASGMYSVLRRSPRANLFPAKPKPEQISAYLQGLLADSKGKTLSEQEKAGLLAEWNQLLERNIVTVEEGDQQGTELYFLGCVKACSQNASFRNQNKFMTREDIYNHPEAIPPYHLGCRCCLVPDKEWNKGDEPGPESSPLLEEGFSVPDWKIIERGES